MNLEMAKCPHRCGPLQWTDDQWFCPKCGDEWDPDVINIAGEPNATVESMATEDPFQRSSTPRRRPQDVVLLEIAAEIEAVFPLHALWLRNMTVDDRREGLPDRRQDSPEEP